jgi:hypothetical protein
VKGKIGSVHKDWHLSTKESFTTQEEILGFSTMQIHYVFNEMVQSSLICNLYGFAKKRLVDYDIFSEMFFNCFG